MVCITRSTIMRVKVSDVTIPVWACNSVICFPRHFKNILKSKEAAATRTSDSCCFASLERLEGFFGGVDGASRPKFEASGLGRELSALMNAASMGEDGAGDSPAFEPVATSSLVHSRSMSSIARKSLREVWVFHRDQGSERRPSERTRQAEALNAASNSQASSQSARMILPVSLLRH